MKNFERKFKMTVMFRSDNAPYNFKAIYKYLMYKENVKSIEEMKKGDEFKRLHIVGHVIL